MAKKTDMNKMLEKYRPALEKFGDEMGKMAKKGEAGVVKMSKLVKIQLDMLGLTLQKEKLYYEIGKEVAEKLLKGDISLPGLDKYKKRLEKVEVEGAKKKRSLSRAGGARKKGKSKKK